ncbi:MAG TPA: asparagine synthase-related protein [Candidatus Krumholzibacteriaceae bacterium]|nr:asparagine synthase-related protein [Candidatus Krumholzibacteriaceae bacterium]
MPGISLIFDRRGKLENQEPSLFNAIEKLLHNNNYTKKIYSHTENLFLAATYHENYRVRCFEDKTLLICVDGVIYGKSSSQIENELKNISNYIFNPERDFKSRITEWILTTDGEYVVFLYNKISDQFCIFNDPLCRLPIYYYYDNDLIMVSREPRFIIELTETADLNHDSIFEYLLLGYSFGEKTLFRKTLQFKGGTVIKMADKAASPEIERVTTFNFEDKKYNVAGIDKHADNLAGLLTDATDRRIDSTRNNLLALSGGLDSRTVSICLSNLNAAFDTVTFLDYFKLFEPDIKYAKDVADTLDVGWELFHAKPATGKDILELLNIKTGMNYLGQSFSVPLLKRIMDTYGSEITFFSGEGGDKVLRDIRPVGNIHNIDHLIKYLIAHNSMIPLDVVSDITGSYKSEFISRLKEHLLKYCEKDMKMKYLQFLFSERCPGWNFQGEDRNRSYLYPVTPYYSIPFFTYSMNIPDTLKQNFKLYRKLMVKLSPEAAAINNAKWNFPITSEKLKLYCALRRIYFAMPAKIRHFVHYRHNFGRRVSPYSEDSNVMNCFKRQLETCGALSDYISPEETVKNIDRIDKTGFEHLFTITSLIEYLHGEESSLEEYLESEMM